MIRPLTDNERNKIFKPLFEQLIADLELVSFKDAQRLISFKLEFKKWLQRDIRMYSHIHQIIRTNRVPQLNGCADCSKALPDNDLDVFVAHGTPRVDDLLPNTRLVCEECGLKILVGKVPGQYSQKLGLVYRKIAR